MVQPHHIEPWTSPSIWLQWSPFRCRAGFPFGTEWLCRVIVNGHVQGSVASTPSYSDEDLFWAKTSHGQVPPHCLWGGGHIYLSIYLVFNTDDDEEHMSIWNLFIGFGFGRRCGRNLLFTFFYSQESFLTFLCLIGCNLQLIIQSCGLETIFFFYLFREWDDYYLWDESAEIEGSSSIKLILWDMSGIIIKSLFAHVNHSPCNLSSGHCEMVQLYQKYII